MRVNEKEEWRSEGGGERNKLYLSLCLWRQSMWVLCCAPTSHGSRLSVLCVVLVLVCLMCCVGGNGGVSSTLKGPHIPPTRV